MSNLAVFHRRGWIVLGIGLVGIVAAIVLYATAPARPSSSDFLSGRSSMDEVIAHNEATGRAFMVGMIGGFVAFVGFGLILRSSKTVRGAYGELIQESASAVARGLHSGPAAPAGAKERLEQLEALRRDRLVSDAEYETKRRDILAEV
jgi:hypothetical protein